MRIRGGISRPLFEIMITGKVFDYKVFNLKDVLHYTGDILPDAYFAHTTDGQSKQDWDAALAAGYRWIRTDGNLVIMERESAMIGGRKFLPK